MTSPWVIAEFQWDAANVWHIWRRHQVTPEEVEEVFVGSVIVRRGRYVHGVVYYEALGQTLAGRPLLVVFAALPRRRIRVATARPMSRAERKWYARKHG